MIRLLLSVIIIVGITVLHFEWLGGAFQRINTFLLYLMYVSSFVAIIYIFKINPKKISSVIVLCAIAFLLPILLSPLAKLVSGVPLTFALYRNVPDALIAAFAFFGWAHAPIAAYVLKDIFDKLKAKK